MLIDCADYDSMGNHGRFPKPKKAKANFFKSIINSLTKIIYAKRG